MILVLSLIAQYFPAGLGNSGLKMWLDAQNYQSYSGSGDTWYDLSGNGNNGIIKSGVHFSSDFGGCFVFPGSGEVTLPSLVSVFPVTVSMSVTHSGDWKLNAPDYNHLMILNIQNRRVSFGVNCKTFGVQGILLFYGGSTHWYSNSLPLRKGINDWNNIIYNINTWNTHYAFLNNKSLTFTSLGGAHGGNPGWAIGSDSAYNGYDYYWRGRFSEVVFYSRLLSITENHLLNAYHSAKSDSTSNSNLISMCESSMKKVDLIGIGRISSSDYFLEPKSTSGGLSFSSDLNTESFLHYDGNFIVAFHNNESLSYIPIQGFSGFRTKRIWYIEKTASSNGNILVSFDETLQKNPVSLIYCPNDQFNTQLLLIKGVEKPGKLLEFSINSENIRSGYYSVYSGDPITTHKTSKMSLILLFSYLFV